MPTFLVKLLDSGSISVEPSADFVSIHLSDAHDNPTNAPELLEAATWVVRLFGTDHPEGIEDLKRKVGELREVCRKARGA